MGFVERFPRFGVNRAVKASQDDFAEGEPGHGRDELPGGRDGTGGSGDDDGTTRRGLFPQFGLLLQQPGAPGSRVHVSGISQDIGPVNAENLEKLQRLLPVFGQILVDQVVQVGQLRVLVLQAVEQGAELAGKTRRLREPAARALHAACESQGGASPTLSDIASIRERYPRVLRQPYLDTAAHCPLSTHTREGMQKYMDFHMYGGGEGRGEYAGEAMRAVKPQFARMIGAKPSEIAFVQNTKAGEDIVVNGLDIQAAGGNVVTNDLHYAGSVHSFPRPQESRHGCSDHQVEELGHRP